MAGRASYHYQYETSPRKLKPEYERKRKPKQVRKRTTNQQVKKHLEQKKKQKKKLENKAKISLFMKSLCLFAIVFCIIFRHSQINEAFAQIQKMKASITTLQKENDQLEVSIQNSVNTNNIEQLAKDLLGMQKLTNKQTININLSKEDFVESKSEKVVIDQEESLWSKIINTLKDIF